MALIIETGSQVVDANSYVSLADARTIATAYGVTLATDDAEAEKNLIVAYQWLKTPDIESTLQGERLSDLDTTTTQTGCYPRTAVYIRGNLIDKNTIPPELIEAQVIASYANQSQSILMPATASTSGAIKKEQLDGVGLVEYYEGSSGDSTTSQLNLALELLKPLLKSAISSAFGSPYAVKGYN